MHSSNKQNWRKQRNFERRMNKFEKSFSQGRANNNPYDESQGQNYNDSYMDDYGRAGTNRYDESQRQNYNEGYTDDYGRSDDYQYQKSTGSYNNPSSSQQEYRRSDDYQCRGSSGPYGNAGTSQTDYRRSDDYEYSGTSGSYSNPASSHTEYGYGEYSAQEDNTGRAGGKKPKKEKPPSHLKGKEIGMWYRDRNKAKQQQLGVPGGRKNQCVPIELPLEKIQVIREFLDAIGIEAPPTVTQIRKGHENFSVTVVEKYRHLEDSEFKRKFLRSISGTLEQQMRNRSENFPHTKYRRDEYLDDMYRRELLDKESDPMYAEMLAFRKRLPAYKKKDDLIDSLERNQVILVSGETGCGKTTQVPQFILDNEIYAGRGSTCCVVCTQPRRISAISVSERVAQERAEQLGVSVGYQIRLDSRLCRKTGAIMFCTTGILLQMMQGDPCITDVSHVVLDEIHERDTLSDFVITILRDIIKMRKDLKIILMSATLNAEQFSQYFYNCPTVHIPGFTYPVKEYYLEDVLQLVGVIYDNKMKRSPKPLKVLKKDKKYIAYLKVIEPYIMSMREQGKYSEAIFEYLMSSCSEEINLQLILYLLAHICNNEPPGAILVFLPGWDKISALASKMNGSNMFPSSKYVVIPLHSMMPTVTQKTIFERPPPGKRKIVIATNIAETSITIDDIVYVVDCGMIKIKNFDMAHNVSTLKEEWVSIANSRQRRGRAGRLRDGVCYHLYARPREMVFENYQLPEMLRTRLEEVILNMKILQLGKAHPFLMKVMDPPPEKIIKLSLELLMNMNALDAEEHLTPLGYHLGQMPVDPQPGKMILIAALFGCVDPITSIAASLTFRDAFVIPLGKESLVDKMKTRMSKGSKSDHLLMAEVISGWRQADREGSGNAYISKHFLSYNTLTQLRNMKKQFVDHLYEMKFVEDRNVESELLNCNSGNHALLRSIICAGLYPNIAYVKRKKSGRGRKIFTVQDGRISIHPKSVVCKCPEIEGGFLTYFMKMKTKSLLMHDCTMIFPMALIFFCQSFTVESRGNEMLIILNKNISFSCDQTVAELIRELRAWLDWLLEYKIANPGTIDWNTSCDETLILKAIVVLLTAESRMYLPECSDQSDTEMNDDSYGGYNDDYM